MRGTAKRLIEAQAPAVPDGGDPLCDYRFRRLVPRAAWDALPEDVRHRFSKSLTGAAVTTYSGAIVWTRLSAAGWLLAQFCRTIGAPLPLASSGTASAAVAGRAERAAGREDWPSQAEQRGGKRGEKTGETR